MFITGLLSASLRAQSYATAVQPQGKKWALSKNTEEAFRICELPGQMQPTPIVFGETPPPPRLDNAF